VAAKEASVPQNRKIDSFFRAWPTTLDHSLKRGNSWELVIGRGGCQQRRLWRLTDMRRTLYNGVFHGVVQERRARPLTGSRGGAKTPKMMAEAPGSSQ
jgi:hypothetical protein